MASTISSRIRNNMQEDAAYMILHDTITCTPLIDPVIDPCGHTFNKSTVEKFEKLPSASVTCPISRRVFKIKELIPNLYAKNVITYLQEDEKRTSHSGSSSSSSSSSMQSTTTSSPISTETTTDILVTLTDELCLLRQTQMTATTVAKKELDLIRLKLTELERVMKDVHYLTSSKNEP